MRILFSVFCIAGLFISQDLICKTPFPARGYAKILTDEEALLRLNNYRSFLIRDLNQTQFHYAYAFQFRLRHMPFRGDESFENGIIYGMAPGHSLSRIDLDSGQSFLLQNGIKPKIWVFNAKTKKISSVSEGELFEPIVGGMNHTLFDILMPFVFWDGVYLKSGKVAGRPAHLFSFRIPDWVNHIKPNLTEIVMALDKSYEAPLRVETYENRNVPSKTYILNSVKKVEDNWIVKSIDCKNRLDRSATRFEVLSAAFNLDLDLSLFSVGGLMNRPTVSVDSFKSTQ